MERIFAPMLVVALAIGCSKPATPASQTSKAAVEAPSDAVAAAKAAAGRWLALVDDGQYAASWDDSAALFQGAVPKRKWVAQLTGAREPFGAMKSRKVRSAKYATELPGAPDGQYVVIQYDTSFENKAAAVETVTPMLQPDGAWRVSGYYVR